MCRTETDPAVSLFSRAEVAKWQTRRIQNPFWFTPGVGSSPTFGISFMTQRYFAAIFGGSSAGCLSRPLLPLNPVDHPAVESINWVRSHSFNSAACETVSTCPAPAMRQSAVVRPAGKRKSRSP